MVGARVGPVIRRIENEFESDGVPEGAAPAAVGTPELSPTTGFVELWDWRRRIADLYGEVRSLDPLAAWQRWRSVRDQLFRDHAQTPLGPERRVGFAGLAYFDYDPALRFTVDLAAPRDSSEQQMEVGRDGTVTLRPFADTRGLAHRLGGELTLYWIVGYGGGVFLPFRDATSGVETYAGGRYLLDTIKGADLGRAPDGRVLLDFNFAYNPSCSYSDQWVCPLAPSGNSLAAPVRAGERMPG